MAARVADSILYEMCVGECTSGNIRQGCKSRSRGEKPPNLRPPSTNSFADSSSSGRILFLLGFLFCGLLLRGESPWRNDTVLTCVCYRLAKVFVSVGDENVYNVAGICFGSQFWQ